MKSDIARPDPINSGNMKSDIARPDPINFEKGINLFKNYPEVSGILCFRESNGKYIFNYLQNQHALDKVEIADGIF